MSDFGRYDSLMTKLQLHVEAQQKQEPLFPLFQFHSALLVYALVVYALVVYVSDLLIYDEHFITSNHQNPSNPDV